MYRTRNGTDSARILWNGTHFVERNGFTRGPERILWNGTDLLMDRNGLARICLSILGPMGPMGPYGALWVPAGTRVRQAAVPAPGVPAACRTRVPAGTHRAPWAGTVMVRTVPKLYQKVQ